MRENVRLRDSLHAPHLIFIRGQFEVTCVVWPLNTEVKVDEQRRDVANVYINPYKWWIRTEERIEGAREGAKNL